MAAILSRPQCINQCPPTHGSHWPCDCLHQWPNVLVQPMKHLYKCGSWFLGFTKSWQCLHWSHTNVSYNWMKYFSKVPEVQWQKGLALCDINFPQFISIHLLFPHVVSCWFSKHSTANLPFVSLVTMDGPLWCNMGVQMSSLTPLSWWFLSIFMMWKGSLKFQWPVEHWNCCKQLNTYT